MLDADDPVLLGELFDPALPSEDPAVSEARGPQRVGRERLRAAVEDGPVRRGEKLGHKFRLINRLDKPIHISSVRSSAAFAKPIVVVELAEMGGAQSAKTEAWIAPHQSIAIEVEMDTERFMGDKTANIYVQFDQPSVAHVQLQVHARSVESPAGTSVKGQPEESKARILELELKVDQLMKQIDALRDELKKQPGKPRSGS